MSNPNQFIQKQGSQPSNQPSDFLDYYLSETVNKSSENPFKNSLTFDNLWLEYQNKSKSSNTQNHESSQSNVQDENIETMSPEFNEVASNQLCQPHNIVIDDMTIVEDHKSPTFPVHPGDDFSIELSQNLPFNVNINESNHAFSEFANPDSTVGSYNPPLYACYENIYIYRPKTLITRNSSQNHHDPSNLLSLSPSSSCYQENFDEQTKLDKKSSVDPTPISKNDSTSFNNKDNDNDNPIECLSSPSILFPFSETATEVYPSSISNASPLDNENMMETNQSPGSNNPDSDEKTQHVCPNLESVTPTNTYSLAELIPKELFDTKSPSLFNKSFFNFKHSNPKVKDTQAEECAAEKSKQLLLSSKLSNFTSRKISHIPKKTLYNIMLGTKYQLTHQMASRICFFNLTKGLSYQAPLPSEDIEISITAYATTSLFNKPNWLVFGTSSGLISVFESYGNITNFDYKSSNISSINWVSHGQWKQVIHLMSMKTFACYKTSDSLYINVLSIIAHSNDQCTICIGTLMGILYIVGCKQNSMSLITYFEYNDVINTCALMELPDATKSLISIIGLKNSQQVLYSKFQSHSLQRRQLWSYSPSIGQLSDVQLLLCKYTQTVVGYFTCEHAILILQLYPDISCIYQFLCPNNILNIVPITSYYINKPIFSFLVTANEFCYIIYTKYINNRWVQEKCTKLNWSIGNDYRITHIYPLILVHARISNKHCTYCLQHEIVNEDVVIYFNQIPFNTEIYNNILGGFWFTPSKILVIGNLERCIVLQNLGDTNIIQNWVNSTSKYIEDSVSEFSSSSRDLRLCLYDLLLMMLERKTTCSLNLLTFKIIKVLTLVYKKLKTASCINSEILSQIKIFYVSPCCFLYLLNVTYAHFITRQAASSTQDSMFVNSPEKFQGYILILLLFVFVIELVSDFSLSVSSLPRPHRYFWILQLPSELKLELRNEISRFLRYTYVDTKSALLSALYNVYNQVLSNVQNLLNLFSTEDKNSLLKYNHLYMETNFKKYFDFFSGHLQKTETVIRSESQLESEEAFINKCTSNEESFFNDVTRIKSSFSDNSNHKEELLNQNVLKQDNQYTNIQNEATVNLICQNPLKLMDLDFDTLISETYISAHTDKNQVEISCENFQGFIVTYHTCVLNRPLDSSEKKLEILKYCLKYFVNYVPCILRILLKDSYSDRQFMLNRFFEMIISRIKRESSCSQYIPILLNDVLNTYVLPSVHHYSQLYNQISDPYWKFVYACTAVHLVVPTRELCDQFIKELALLVDISICDMSYSNHETYNQLVMYAAELLRKNQEKYPVQLNNKKKHSQVHNQGITNLSEHFKISTEQSSLYYCLNKSIKTFIFLNDYILLSSMGVNPTGAEDFINNLSNNHIFVKSRYLVNFQELYNALISYNEDAWLFFPNSYFYLLNRLTTEKKSKLLEIVFYFVNKLLKKVHSNEHKEYLGYINSVVILVTRQIWRLKNSKRSLKLWFSIFNKFYKCIRKNPKQIYQICLTLILYSNRKYYGQIIQHIRQNVHDNDEAKSILMVYIIQYIELYTETLSCSLNLAQHTLSLCTNKYLESIHAPIFGNND